MAYIGYYVAEAVCHTSGVIATLTSGLVVKYAGRSMLNDTKLMDDFWTLVEHILNTVLFTLGGVVWGATLTESEERGFFTAKDWGYLILLYVLLHVIRAVLFFGIYPLTSRIGLKTNVNETFFQVFGGLRGAVGIALAIFLDNEVTHFIKGPYLHESTTDEMKQDIEIIELQVNKVFAMVGGIAFLTLVINATAAGPLLRKLGLADSTETRDKMISTYKVGFREKMIANFVELLTQRRFRHVNFSLVKKHVHTIADLTRTELCAAVECHRDTAPSEGYTPPRIDHVLPFLPEGQAIVDCDDVVRIERRRHSNRPVGCCVRRRIVVGTLGGSAEQNVRRVLGVTCLDPLALSERT